MKSKQQFGQGCEVGNSAWVKVNAASARVDANANGATGFYRPVVDSSAESTGFTFSPDGQTAYVSIQHSDDTNMSTVDDYGTDDLLVITGFSDPATL